MTKSSNRFFPSLLLPSPAQKLTLELHVQWWTWNSEALRWGNFLPECIFPSTLARINKSILRSVDFDQARIFWTLPCQHGVSIPRFAATIFSLTVKTSIFFHSGGGDGEVDLGVRPDVHPGWYSARPPELCQLG